MIKKIEIQNIKGIGHGPKSKTFDLGIVPNKPSLLVAPNGFGKSSIATAFNSMNNRRIDLNEDDLYQGNISNSPLISIEYRDSNGRILTLTATNRTNTISEEFDYYVINNQTKPKGNASTFSGFANTKASLIIEDIILVDRIPYNVPFNYSLRNYKSNFGLNGKVLPNLTPVLINLKLIENITSYYEALQRADGKKIQRRIENLISEINEQNGTSEDILDWITSNKLSEFEGINYLNTIGELINQYDIGYNSKTKSYLAAIQLIWLFNDNQNEFKKACLYNNYKLNKHQFDTTLSTFNSTWKNIRSIESGGKLLVKFPKAIYISNGQRDVLTFISMLFKAKRKLQKGSNILIIDEVFDYLDDANLTAAQYYITKFIKEFDSSGKKLYPLILTHLNPNYFKNFAFSNQKVYYLDKSSAIVNPHMIRLLRNRDHLSIKDDVSKFLLHYNPNVINKRNQFRNLGIPELWGENDNFIKYLNNEVDNYLNNRSFDPFAVCGAVRIKIEEIAYNKLQNNESRQVFLATHNTRQKLEKTTEMGIISPESHFLLGIIYNEGMHWKDNQDNISPISSKLENLTIKKLIRDIFS